MVDPKPNTKKEEQHSSKQGAEPAKTVLPEGMSYPTPELDPNTGAPLDTRFQSGGASQEATASQQSPKSGSATGAQTAQAKGKNDEDEDDEDDDSDKTKNKEKPKSRR